MWAAVQARANQDPSHQGIGSCPLTTGTAATAAVNSRRLVPRLQKLLPRGELHYVEFNGPHVVRSDIAQEALDWFLEGVPIQESSYSRAA